MNAYLSKKIKIVSFLSILCVFFIHAYNYTDNYLESDTRITEGTNVHAMIQFFFGNGFAKFAVPLFFAISGYLFFRNFTFTRKSYGYKLYTRFFSLLVPYVIWGLLSGIVIWISYNYLGQWKENYCAYAWTNYRNNGIYQWVIEPTAYQFWFIRQLIYYTILSPIIYLLLKYLKCIPLLVLVYNWIQQVEIFFDIGFYEVYIDPEGLLIFCIGAYIAINHQKILNYRANKTITIPITIVWLALTAVYTYCAATFGDTDMELQTLVYMNKAIVAFGFVSVWMLVDLFSKYLLDNKVVEFGASNVFFVFAFHEPLLTLVTQYILNEESSDYLHTLCYFGLPILFILVGMLGGWLLRKYLNPVHQILTGNR